MLFILATLLGAFILFGAISVDDISGNDKLVLFSPIGYETTLVLPPPSFFF